VTAEYESALKQTQRISSMCVSRDRNSAISAMAILRPAQRETVDPGADLREGDGSHFVRHGEHQAVAIAARQQIVLAAARRRARPGRRYG